MTPDEVRLRRATKNILELVSYIGTQSISAPVVESVPDKSEVTTHTPVKETEPNATVNSLHEGYSSSERPKASHQTQRKKKGKAAVVSWDLGHNPAGRALVLYRLLEKDWDVELIGPIWSRYGTALWEPLRESDLNIRSFGCKDLMDFVPKAELLSSAGGYDLVYVCKPRLPSIFLGGLISQSSNCPLIVDVDDFELSFFQSELYSSIEELEIQGYSALEEPYEELATRYCQTLVKEFDAVTVSNISLKRRFKGSLIRHASDEADFKYSDDAREIARSRLGARDDEFVLLFVGTPRPHKGVIPIIEALEEIDDPTIVFHIVGDITDSRFKKELESFKKANVVFHPNCDFSELPRILPAADLVPLIQDVDHPISEYQIPAKISDATSMGIPVIMTATPPVEDLILTGGVYRVEAENLSEEILNVRSKINSGEICRADIRKFFTDELSYAVNRARLQQVIESVENQHRCSSVSLNKMLEIVRRIYREKRSQDLSLSAQSAVQMFNATQSISKTSVPIQENHDGVRLLASENSDYKTISSYRNDSSKLKWIRSKINVCKYYFNRTKPRYNGKYDIAFFWKQNDSGIYGRRSDMVFRYLKESGRVRSIVQFDAPIAINTIEQQLKECESLVASESVGQQGLILRNLYDRSLGLLDDDISLSRTFVSSARKKVGKLLGKDVPSKKEYAEYVKQQLYSNGMDPSTTIAWFCPVIWEAPMLIKKLGFAALVSDLIDDQRAWNSSNVSYKNKLESNYLETLSESDLVFANCESLANAFSDTVDRIHVIPNGAENISGYGMQSMPEGIVFPDGPVIGYVGNLRDRIDWLLLHNVVKALPNVSFVFIGPTSNNENARELEKHRNVFMTGVIPYDEMVHCMVRFNVGILPHLNNQLTARMNPLKVYNYFSAGLPIVSTEVENLAQFGSRLKVARDDAEFVAAINAALELGKDNNSIHWEATMSEISWAKRVDTMLNVMDRSLLGKLCQYESIDENNFTTRKIA